MASKIIIPAGYTRSYRGNSAVQQEAALRAHGIKVVYYGDKGETVKHARGKLRRKGEMLGVYGGLRALAEKRKEVAMAVEFLRLEGFHVIDILTGERSDINGVAMLDKAWKTFNAETRVPNLEKAAEYGSIGGTIKGENASRARMPKAKALRIWQDKRTYRTVTLALEHMPNWTKALAYKYLGDRDDKPGRRKEIRSGDANR